MPVYTKIVGTGSYLPPYVADNSNLVSVIKEKTGDWIERRLGIKERRFFAPIEDATGRAKEKVDEIGMAETAARQALQEANLKPEQISGLWYITCTQRPDEYLHFSRAAIELHRRLRLTEDAFALEIDSGCGGVMQAVGVANDMIKGDDKPNVLIVASNAPSFFIDRDVYTATGVWLGIYIFGDGAGAMVLQKANNNKHKKAGILATYYSADGSHPLMYFHQKNRGDDTNLDNHVYEIDAKAVKDLFPVFMRRSIEGLKKRHNFSLEEIDRFYFHQANRWALEEFARSFEIPLEKVAVNVDKYGNLSAASTLVLLDEDLRKGDVRIGDLCLFAAVGAGAHYGAFLVRL